MSNIQHNVNINSISNLDGTKDGTKGAYDYKNLIFRIDRWEEFKF